MEILRYLPCSLWYRGALSCAAGAVWLFCLPWAAEQLVSSPEVPLDQRHPFGLRPAFTQWSDPAAQAENVLFLLCLLLAISGLLLALAGRHRRNGVPTQGKE